MLCLSAAALGLTFFSINAAAGPLALPEAIASLVSNLPSDHAASLASLVARGNDPPALLEKSPNSSSLSALNSTNLGIPQNSSMSAIIDAYIVNLQQAGYVPNANASTTLKRDTLSLEPLVEKRSVPSVPLVIALLGQHGFVPANGTADGPSSKRELPDREAALLKRSLPDVELVVDRLAAHGFVPTGNNGSNSSAVGKRDAEGDINSVITRLEALGFTPEDFRQGGNESVATMATAEVNATRIEKRASRWVGEGS